MGWFEVLKYSIWLVTSGLRVCSDRAKADPLRGCSKKGKCKATPVIQLKLRAKCRDPLRSDDSKKGMRQERETAKQQQRQCSDAEVLVGVDVFGADSYSYEAGGEATEEWMGGEETEEEGWFDGGGVAEEF